MNTPVQLGQEFLRTDFFSLQPTIGSFCGDTSGTNERLATTFVLEIFAHIDKKITSEAP